MAWVDGATGMITVRDYQLDGKSASQVVEDDAQDIELDVDSSTYNDGVLRVRFNRPRVTGENGVSTLSQKSKFSSDTF